MSKMLTAAMAAACLLSTAWCATALAAPPTWTLGGTSLKETVSVKSKFTGPLTIEDAKATTVPTEVECKGTDSDALGVEGKGEITEVVLKECKAVKGTCSGTLTVTALHTPWKVQLEEPADGSNREKISGASVPGWKVECTVLGIKATDECTGEITHDVLAVTGGVDTLFETDSEASEALNCTQGGSGQGLVAATDLYENIGEQVVSVSNGGCELVHPCFEIKNPGGPFVTVGEKRMIEVIDTVAAGTPASLSEFVTRVGFLTVNNTQVSTCRTKSYALLESCSFEVTYSKKREASEPIVALNVLVLLGNEPTDRLRLPV